MTNLKQNIYCEIWNYTVFEGYERKFRIKDFDKGSGLHASKVTLTILTINFLWNWLRQLILSQKFLIYDYKFIYSIRFFEKKGDEKKLYAVQQGGHSIKHKVSLLVSFCVPLSLLAERKS